MGDGGVLVTGGAGFIGSHLCERLLAQGHRVLCLDNFLSGSEGNVRHLLKSNRFELVRHDVCTPYFPQSSRIFNLACPASPVLYQVDPVATTRIAVLGTLNTLGMARRLGARFLQASTSEIYGDPLVHPQNEDYTGNVDPTGERACYDEGKRCAETLCFDYRRQYGVDVRVARIFNTYGPRMRPDDGRVVSNFVIQALSGADLTVFGDGSQTRSFCYVDDLVDALLRLMEADHVARPLNLGNPLEVSMLELAEIIIRLARSPSGIAFRTLPNGDPMRRQPDIGRARRALGWQPTTGLDEGLRRTIDYFRRGAG